MGEEKMLYDRLAQKAQAKMNCTNKLSTSIELILVSSTTVTFIYLNQLWEKLHEKSQNGKNVFIGYMLIYHVQNKFTFASEQHRCC